MYFWRKKGGLKICKRWLLLNICGRRPIGIFDCDSRRLSDMAGTITSVSFLNDSRIPRDYHDSNSLTKTSALSKIKECEDVKVNRIVHTDGNKLSNKSSVTDKKTKGRVHQGLTEKKTKTDTSKATTTQKVVKDSKKSKVGSKLLTQRSLSDDTPQQMRVRETRERRRDSDVNCNSHYLLEYRRRLRQMSV